MKPLSGITSALLITALSFINSCSCGNDAEIRDGDAKFRSMKNGILMVTKKSCLQKPATMNELVQCVEQNSTSENGYGITYLTEFTGVSNSGTLGGSGKDIAFYYDFSFKVTNAGKWIFEFGIDAGIASGCLIDDRELWFESNDIWTLGDYSKAFKKDVQLKKGWHRMRIYGLENCCDGVWRLRFKSPSMKNFEIVSVKNPGVKCPVKI